MPDWIGSTFNLLGQHTNVITAFTALAAVTIGPFLSYLVTKKQLYAATVSLNRIKWVEDLRTDIANFLSDYYEAVVVTRRFHLQREEKDRASFLDNLTAARQRIVKSKAAIALRLNPDEEPHAKLIALLESCLNQLNEFANDKERRLDLRALTDEVVTLAKPILKTEWTRARQFQ